MILVDRFVIGKPQGFGKAIKKKDFRLVCVYHLRVYKIEIKFELRKKAFEIHAPCVFLRTVNHENLSQWPIQNNRVNSYNLFVMY